MTNKKKSETDKHKNGQTRKNYENQTNKKTARKLRRQEKEKKITIWHKNNSLIHEDDIWDKKWLTGKASSINKLTIETIFI